MPSEEVIAMNDTEPKVRTIRPDLEISTLQRLPYFVGISGRTVDAGGLSMHLVVIPPGARSEPHQHVGHETAIYVLEGLVLTRWGAALEHEVVSQAGEFLFIPPGTPHEAINLSATQPARAVVARNDPAEQDKVQPVPRSSEADREFVHARLIAAPRERVFRAFAEPAHLARWWGPEGFSSIFERFEFRRGGTWRFVMRGPDGTDHPNEIVFREILAPERIVLEHLGGLHHFFLTLTLEARGEQTLVGWQQVFDTAAHRERIAAFVSQANEQNLDRLAAEVREL
jgi:uncharacterized RmlC-like cupin family protein